MIGGKRRRRARRVDTLVGGNTVIHGDVEFSGGLHVEGRVMGDVRAPSDGSAVLVVAEQGSIEGQVTVPHLVMNGEVRGDIHVSEHVELGQTARLSGNLYYNLLQMEEGACIDGQLKRTEAPLQGELEEPVASADLQTPTTREHS
ncbi:MAG: bactofilin family protein [Pseudomonadota bacterium]